MGELRSPSEIIRVVETFDEAYRIADLLQPRDIGALCMKGVAVGDPTEFWRRGGELRTLAAYISNVTRGEYVGPTILTLRRTGDAVSNTSKGVPAIFTGDESMHLDGASKLVRRRDGNGFVGLSSTPLINPQWYLGAGNHITRSGETTLVMDRLADTKVAEYARRQDDADSLDSPDPVEPHGEAVALCAGDYVALHQFGFTKGPSYEHGSINSTDDRRSMLLTPEERLSDRIRFIEKDGITVDLSSMTSTRPIRVFSDYR